MIKDMSVNVYQVVAVCQEVGWVLYMESHLIVHAEGQGHVMGAEAVTKRLGTLTEDTQLPSGPAGTQAWPCGISSQLSCSHLGREPGSAFGSNKRSSLLSSTWLFG